MSVTLPVSINADIALTADIVADGEEKRIPTLEEIAGWNSGTGGGLPEGTNLDEIPDGATRAAVTPADVTKLASYAANDGKTGDAHALVTGNPHGTTAADVGAPTTAQFTTLQTTVTANSTSIDAINTSLTSALATISTHTSQISELQSDVTDLQGGTPGLRWLYGPILGVSNQSFSSAAGSTLQEWNVTLRQPMYLDTASKFNFWAKIPTASTGGSSHIVLPIYKNSSDTDWQILSTGLALSLGTQQGFGAYSGAVNSSLIDTLAKSATGVLVSIGSLNSSSTSAQIAFPHLDVFDSAVVQGGTITLPIGLDDTTDDVSGSGRLAMTNAERTKVGNVPSDTNASLALKAASSDVTASLALKANSSDVSASIATLTTAVSLKAASSDVTAALALKADSTAVTASLALKFDSSDATLKAPLLSPVFTTPTLAGTPASTSTGTQIVDAAWVLGKSYLASLPSHSHSVSDLTSGGLPLSSTLANLQAQISALSGGANDTYATLTVTSTAVVNLPDNDVVFIEHTGFNAQLRIPATLSKKAHVCVLLGNPNTANFAGATGSSQTIKGAGGGGLTFASGTDSGAVSRVLAPDPDTTNFPNRWRIF